MPCLKWHPDIPKRPEMLLLLHPPAAAHPSPLYRITGGLPSRFHLTRLRIHSTASRTPVPFNALTGSTRLSRTPPPFSPSKTGRTSPSLIRTVSTQSSRSCLLAKTRMGTPTMDEDASTDSSTNLHSARRPVTVSSSRSPGEVPMGLA